jgi:hypothetical protein
LDYLCILFISYSGNLEVTVYLSPFDLQILIHAFFAQGLFLFLHRIFTLESFNTRVWLYLNVWLFSNFFLLCFILLRFVLLNFQVYFISHLVEWCRKVTYWIALSILQENLSLFRHHMNLTIILFLMKIITNQFFVFYKKNFHATNGNFKSCSPMIYVICPY